MQINNAGLALIKEFEGFVDRWYRDPVGIWTCCYGHTDAAGDPKHSSTTDKRFTEAEGAEILRRDLGQYEQAVSRAVKVPLNENQFSALTSFTYNLGPVNLGTSTLLRRLNAGDYEGAAAEFPKWNKAGGKALAGLTRRRAAERALFETPAATSSDPLTEIQTVLHRLGLYNARVDGIDGPKTQAAINAFNAIAADMAAWQSQLEN